ncbi:MAG: hypothetical protein NTY37_04820 [Methanothrix sp.]|nr:hypothetical protein [Methanothrix sp.]
MISSAFAMGAYFALFAVVHSFLADPRFKRRARGALGRIFDRWQRLAYNLLALLMTENLLAFNILAMVYFYLGVRHEERSPKEEFGEQYEEYKKLVPMFLPRLRC